MHWAALCPEADGAEECLKILLPRENVLSLLDKQSSSGSTPLHCALSRCHQGAVKLLVEKGADQKLKDEDGKTAVALAKEAGKAWTKLLSGKK